MTEKYCKVCEETGFKHKLVCCRVNFEEGIWLCESDMKEARELEAINHNLFQSCVYPFGDEGFNNFLVKTPVSKVTLVNQEGPTQSEAIEKCSTILNKDMLGPDSHFYWSNSDNLCWLDSVMTLLVNNKCLRLCLEKYHPKGSILQELYSDFNAAQKLGLSKQGKELLYNARLKVFKYLKSKMHCSLGVKDSALVALTTLLRDCLTINDKFVQECQWTFQCDLCGYSQVDRYSKTVVTFPNTTKDFSLPSGMFLRSCYKCKAPRQKCELDLIQLPPCVIVHFLEGVKNTNFLKSGFVCQDKKFELCQMIQYKKNPDHFVTWVKSFNGSHWGKIDDAEDCMPMWEKTFPSFPLEELHIAVWQRAKLYRRKYSSAEAGETSKQQAVVCEATGLLNSGSEVSVCNAIGSKTAGYVSDQKPEMNLLLNVNSSQAASPRTLLENVQEKHSDSVDKARLKEPPFVSKISLFSKHCDTENVSAVSEVSVHSDASKTLLDSASQKRKNTFEPYIPKKKRALKQGEENLESNKLLSSTISNVKDIVSKCSEVACDKEKTGVILDIDSGYSSPGSNSSCLSLPAQATAKDDPLTINDIIDTLNEMELPYCNDSNYLSSADSCRKSSSVSSNTFLNEQDLLYNRKRSNLKDMPVDFLNTISSQNSDFSNLSSFDQPSGSVCHEDIVNDSKDTSTLPCDFADIDTLSNGDLFQELDSLDFLDFSTRDVEQGINFT